MSHVIRWDSSWLRWPDQCRTISVNVAYRPGHVLELTISIEGVWLHPEEEHRSRLMLLPFLRKALSSERVRVATMIEMDRVFFPGDVEDVGVGTSTSVLQAS